MTTVLLVEDTELRQDMLSTRLERRGYHVLVVTSGDAGWATALAHAPDVILVGVGPAVACFKRDPATRDIPILGLTVDALGDRALGAGCDDIDTRPIDLARLMTKMEALLTRPPRL
jgi:CheY-like chemotaxis protein